MCKSTGLRIVNGRIGEDRGIGNLTCITANGTSLVEYVLSDTQLFNIFCHFKVCDANEFSDHCIVEFSILSQMPRISTNIYHDVNTMKRKKYVWNPNNAKSEEFIQSISSVNTLNKLSDIVQGIENITDCEAMSRLAVNARTVLAIVPPQGCEAILVEILQSKRYCLLVKNSLSLLT